MEDEMSTNFKKVNYCHNCYTKYADSRHKVPVFDKHGNTVLVNDPIFCCKSCRDEYRRELSKFDPSEYTYLPE